MPSLKDALTPPANLADMVQVEAPNPTPPPAPALAPREQPGLAVGSLGPAPSTFTTDYDRVRQWYRPGTSQNRFPPLPTKVNPQVNSQVQSIAAKTAAAVAVQNVALSEPPEFTVSGSPVVPPGGALTVAWAAENPGAVLQVPPPGLSSLQAVATTSGPTGTPISISGTPKSTAATAILFWFNQGATATPPGWTGAGNTNAFTKSSAPYSANFSFTPAADWAAQMLIFSGSVNFIQGNNTTNVFGTVSFPSNTVAGNTIIVYMKSFNFTTQPPINPTFSDSQGNVYQQIVSQVATFPDTQNRYWTSIWIATNIVGGADTITFNFNDPAPHSGHVDILELSPLSSGGSFLPSFIPLFQGEIPPISLTANGNGGVTGVLPTSSGGTGTGNAATGTAGSVVLSNSPTIATPTISGNETLNGKLSTYNSIATVAGGVPAEYAKVDLTAQAAAITTTTLYAVPSTGAGQYRLSWNAKVTQPATVSSTLGALTITYTDPDGVVQTITCAAQNAAGTIETSDNGNATTTVLLGLDKLLNCKASTNIQYAFAYTSSGATAMQYNLHITLEAM